MRLFYYSYYNTNHYYGIVEVYLSDEWGTVANDGSWSIEDGQVVCRQLGFDISSKLYSTCKYKYYSVDIYMCDTSAEQIRHI